MDNKDSDPLDPIASKAKELEETKKMFEELFEILPEDNEQERAYEQAKLETMIQFAKLFSGNRPTIVPETSRQEKKQAKPSLTKTEKSG